MKVIMYEGKKYIPKEVNYLNVCYEDYVCIEGICGYVDFLGSEDIAIVDESNITHYFKVADTKILMLKKNMKSWIEQIEEKI